MDIRKVLALRGPNVWADFPVLEAWVDLESLADSSSDQLPGFSDRLCGWLPSLIEHRCSMGSRGGFFERLRRGTYLAHVLEHVALELQCLAGTEATFGRARETSEAGVYRVAFEYEHEDLGRATLPVARELCLAAVEGRSFDVAAEVAKLRELVEQLRPAPLAAAVTRAARRRGIPVRPMAEGGLLLLGQGARQRRVLGARTDRTGALAESISRDAALTRDLLRAVGVPVAEENAAARWRLLTVGGRVAATVSLGTPGETSPEVAARAVEAAEVVGLDVAGVVVAEGGVISVEANPAVEGAAAEAVGESIVAGLFAEGQNGRIPVVAVTGVNGKTTTTRLIAHVLTQSRRRVGFTCTEGIYVGGRGIEPGDCSGPRSAQTVLQHPEVDAAVLETARGGILRAGLGFDLCDVAVVTNVGEGDHLGCGDVETVEQLARVKRTIIDVVPRGGTAVLVAADPLVVSMAEHCRGSVIFFARDPEHPVIVSHRAGGNRVAFVRDGRIVLAQGEDEVPLALLKRVPLTGGGRIGFQIDNALAAAAAAWALGVERETIRAALKSFAPDVDHTPARFNLLEVNGAVAVLDYGHNASSLAAVIEALEHLPMAHRTAVYSAAGDRRDADLIRQGELLGDSFDRVILYEDEHCTRGRKAGEIIGLFRRGMADRLRVSKIQEVIGAVRAVDEALTAARPGELLLLQVDVVDETMELVRGYLAGAAAREISLDQALAITAGARAEPGPELAEAAVSVGATRGERAPV